MFKPNELEAFSMALDEPMKSLETRIMEDIVRRIKINGEVTRAADWQINRLIQLGMSKREIKKYIKDSLNLNTQEINHLYRDIIHKGYARDESLYKFKGKPFTPFDENTGLQQLISSVASQTNSELKNITQSLGFAVRQPDGKLKFINLADYYQQTLDGAMLDIASGAFDYNTVLKRVVSEMTNSGLRSVDYASGWSNRVDVAARRAVMTGMSQLASRVNEDNARELGTDMFEITWHSGARPTHWWGGKWFTRKQLEEVCGLGTVTGLCGANCYHDYYPVIPGISEPSYTEEELAELNRRDNTPVEYNGKKYTKYEALQRQRSLETTMRAQRQKIKLLQDGGANEEDIINARAKYRVTSAEYARFSKAMDIPQQRERVTVDGLGNIGVGKYKTSSGKAAPVKTGGGVKPSGKAVEVDVPAPPTNGGTGKLYEPEKIPGKTVDNSGESGIINIENQYSELGRFKQKISADKRIDKEYYSMLKEKFSHGSDDAKALFNKYVPENSVENANLEVAARYDPNTKKISMHYGADLNNERGAGATWFHEHGHMIDDLAGGLSDSDDFYELLRKDKSDYVENIIRKNHCSHFDEAYSILEKELNDFRSQSGVSDIFNGLSAGTIRGCAGHDTPGYWNDSSVCHEAFAHMFEAQFDEIRYKEMQRYFPNSLSYFENMLKGALR